MSGFRKFRSSLQRRRRGVEAMELGILGPASRIDVVDPPPPFERPPSRAEQAGAIPLPEPELTADREAVEIGPSPPVVIRPRRPATDH